MKRETGAPAFEVAADTARTTRGARVKAAKISRSQGNYDAPG
jgi:hypothetical protein